MLNGNGIARSLPFTTLPTRELTSESSLGSCSAYIRLVRHHKILRVNSLADLRSDPSQVFGCKFLS